MIKDIDIILPSYKPKDNWASYLIQRIESLKQLKPEWRFNLIIVSDGSNLGHSPEVRALLKANFPDMLYVDYPENRGKGYALRSGVKVSTAEYVLYTDWDFPFTEETYLKVLEGFEEGAKLILAERVQVLYRKKLNPMRLLLSSGSHLINSLLLKLPSNDTQAGLKGFHQSVKPIFLKTKIDRFLFDSEFICLATKLGQKIDIVKAVIRPDIQLSKMTMKTLMSEISFIPKLIRARWFS